MSVLGTFNGWNVVTLPGTQLRSVDFTDHEIVAQSASPWTGQTQSYDWGQSFLSAVVTLATMTRAQSAAWIAALRSARGPLNVFQLGDPSLLLPFGVAGPSGGNLVPDSGLFAGFGQWTSAGSAWSIGAGAGLNGANAFVVTSAAGGTQQYSNSMQFNLTAGQTYTVSIYIDATNASGRTPMCVLYPPASDTTYAAAEQTGGQKGRISTTFTMPGTAGTVLPVVMVLGVNAATLSGNLIFSSPMVQLGGGMTAYAPNYCGIVNGAGQSGFSLITNGWPASVANLLLPGDYLSIMSAGINGGDIAIPRLFTAQSAVSSDSGGNATIPIWPPLRESPAAGAPLILANTQGLFRRVGNEQKWNVNYDRTSSRSFSIVEAL